MDSDVTAFFLMMASIVTAIIYWAQLKFMLFLVMKVAICLAAVIFPSLWSVERDKHKGTKAELETMVRQHMEEKQHRKNVEGHYRTLLSEYEEQTKFLNHTKKENEDLKMSIENQYGKELKRMKTLTIVYHEFRQWIEDEAASSYSRVCFTKYKPSEVEEVTKSLHTMRCLGTGTYGSVYEAIFQNKNVAMKILNDNQKGMREFKQEVRILKRIRHQNLVTLIGACSDKYTLIYELLPNGTLEDRLTQEKQRVSFSWKERVSVADSICSALVFLHNTKPNPIAHGDLKPSNILFDANNVCKLGDFGISRFLKQTTDTATNYHSTEEPKGSGPYWDPEFRETGKLTAMSDVFALGIILLQLVTGKEALGLRKLVLDTMQPMNLENYTKKLKKKILAKSGILDAKVEWDEKAVEDAIKMISLGIACSNKTRYDRPSLETEVWPEISAITSQNAAWDIYDHPLD